MAEKTSFTKTRLDVMSDQTLYSAVTVGEVLTLKNKADEVVFTGNVKGLVGNRGSTGEVSEADLVSAILAAHAPGAIHGNQLADASVTEAKLASNAVDTSALAAGAVTAAKVADNSVSQSKFYTGSVSSAKVAATSITTSKLEPSSVTQSKLAIAAYHSSGNFRCERLGDFVFVYSGAPWAIGALTLPVGFRPSVGVGFPVYLSSGSDPTWNYRMLITTAGVVTIAPGISPESVVFSATYKAA